MKTFNEFLKKYGFSVEKVRGFKNARRYQFGADITLFYHKDKGTNEKHFSVYFLGDKKSLYIRYLKQVFKNNDFLDKKTTFFNGFFSITSDFDNNEDIFFANIKKGLDEFFSSDFYQKTKEQTAV